MQVGIQRVGGDGGKGVEVASFNRDYRGIISGEDSVFAEVESKADAGRLELRHEDEVGGERLDFKRVGGGIGDVIRPVPAGEDDL